MYRKMFWMKQTISYIVDFATLLLSTFLLVALSTEYWATSLVYAIWHYYYSFHPPQYRTEFIDISFFLPTLDVPLTDRTSDTFVKKNLRRSNLKFLPDHRLTVRTDIFRHQAPYHIFHSFIILSSYLFGTIIALDSVHTVAIWTFTFHEKSGFI